MFRSAAKRFSYNQGYLVSRQCRRHFHVDYVDLTGISIRGLYSEDTTKSVVFHNLFLRDATMETDTVDPDSKQKCFSTGQVPGDVHATKTAVVEDADGQRLLKITWSDGHRAEYPEYFLRRYASKERRRQYRGLSTSSSWVSWGSIKRNDYKGSIYHTSFDSYMNNQNAFNKAVRQLEAIGLVVLEDVPEALVGSDSEIMVEKIAKKMGVIRDTFYGRTWDVKSIPQAKNVAYTSVYLPLHMDLCYYESPPGVQLLHVINNEATGGESLFADSYAAALHVRETDLEAYKVLCEIPFTFHYVNDGYSYYYERPLIVEDPYSPRHPVYGVREIQHINYSPPFQGPLDEIATLNDISAEKVEVFRRGLGLFEQYISDEKNRLELKMKESTCMIFMNRRILHGRREFDPSTGKRWLKGTYLDIDSFNSQRRIQGNFE